MLTGRLASRRPPAGARVLLLGEARAEAGAVQARGWQPVPAATTADFGVEPGSCDAAIVDRALEHEPFERWFLQRVHRTLRVGGPLVLRERNELDLATPAGAGYVAVRGAGEVLRRIAAAAGMRRPPGASFRGRRSGRARLSAMLEGLRFTALADWTEGPAWLPPRFHARLGSEAVAGPSIPGRDGQWPEPQAHAARYRAEQAHLIATRERWLARHPAWQPGAAQPCEPAAFAGRTVLVLAPHPDDEVIGAGGTLLRMVAAGARVVCVQATDGSAGAALERTTEAERREVRVREALAVGRRAGFAETIAWREDNRAFRDRPELAQRLAALLERERPAVILAPFVTEAHADHLTLLRILAAALEAAPARAAECEVWSYEVWSVLPCNLWCEVTEQMPAVEQLLFEYDTAMRIDDFVRFCADRNLEHSRTLRGRNGYVEAFHRVPANRYRELLAAAPERR